MSKPVSNDDDLNPGNTTENEAFAEVLERRLDRRTLLKGAAGAAMFVAVPPLLEGCATSQTGASGAPGQDGRLAFTPITLSNEDAVIVPPGYSAHVLIRWGDPLQPGAPALDVANQTGASQAGQFGYNCDFIGYFPMPDQPSRNSNSGLLAVNHEFSDRAAMGLVGKEPTAEQVQVELAAHGMSIVEVERRGGQWGYKKESRLNRRITMQTPMTITGPAAGHDWMKTSDDPTGTRVLGMLNNCAGGKTPWGTVLTGEENTNYYFGDRAALAAGDPRTGIHTRFGMATRASRYMWENHQSRFSLAKEPNEPFRFGWVVEIDPYDPTFVPKKRTALGRLKHEGATAVVGKDGRVAVYSGDDERFEYMYKFVTAGRFDPKNRAANMSLLDTGTLYVAKFRDDGRGEWLPLVHGQGPLVAANGLGSQADVVIKTRFAADAVGGTKMDRPEDVETNPKNGKVYCVMSKNDQRGTDGKPAVDGANPRPANVYGHVIELTEAGNDAAATAFTWNVFMRCGDPKNAADQADYAGFDPSRISPISNPDNVTFDQAGNMWLATDGAADTFKKNDGLYAVPVEGEERGYLRQFLSAPVAAEVCGPEFTPDDTTLFVAIQHPGRGGEPSYWPESRHPSGPPATPRPSVVAITKNGGGRVGS